MSSDRTKSEAVKTALRVYENKHRGDNFDIFDHLQSKYPTSKLGSISVSSKKLIESPSLKKEINRTIKRYMKQSETILGNVCIGKFP